MLRVAPWDIVLTRARTEVREPARTPMNIIDRFTRDEVSQIVWGGVTIALAAALMLSFAGENAQIRDARRAAEVRALAHASAVGAAATGLELDGSLEDAARDELAKTLARQVLAVDRSVARVRIWSLDGFLRLSTDPADPLDSGEALNDDIIEGVAATGDATFVSAGPTAAVPDAARELQAYVPIPGEGSPEPTGIAEIDHAWSTLFAAIHDRWRTLRLVGGVALLPIVALLVLSFRPPVARIGAGAPFTPASLPPDLAVVSAEELREMDQVATVGRERVERLRRELERSEEGRRRAEGELQNVLSQIASKIKPAGAAPEPLRAAPLRAAEPSTVEPVKGARARPSRAEPAKARPVKPVKAEPAAKLQPRAVGPATVEPRVEPAQAEPSVEPRAKPERIVAETPEPARSDVPVRAEPAAPAPTASVDEDIVVIPDLADDEADVAGGEGTGSGVLERLVGEVTLQEHTDTNPDLRSRLARTAALKKPGSRERREEYERRQRAQGNGG
jgi:hypothetical protein